LYTGCGKLSLFIGYSAATNVIEEIYVKRSGKGGCARSLDALAITMSSMLRLGGNVCNIEMAFEGLEPCNSFTKARAKGKNLSTGSNCAMVILNELQQFENEGTDDKQLDMTEHETVRMVLDWTPQCPECGEEMQRSGGCIICNACGYTQCE